jgi:hypothetical protein
VSAAWFWATNGLNTLADAGDNANTIFDEFSSRLMVVAAEVNPRNTGVRHSANQIKIRKN